MSRKNELRADLHRSGYELRALHARGPLRYVQHVRYREREARAATSTDLGHGRERYIARVYARPLCAWTVIVDAWART